MLQLSQPVSILRMIGPSYLSKLKNLEIETIEDLLYHIPFRYDNYSLVSKVSDLQEGERVTVIGTIKFIKNIYTRHGRKIQKAELEDDTGKIDIVWYNQPFLITILHTGTKVSIAGEVKWFGKRLSFESPDYEIIQNFTHHTQLIHSGRLVPVYPETAGISSKWLRSRIYSLLFKFSPQIEEFLPGNILRKFQLMDEKEAIFSIHFPADYDLAQKARKRLEFDELLTLSLFAQINRRKRENEKTNLKFKVHEFGEKISKFIINLPFALTSAQKKSIEEIVTDLKSDKPMNRLLEGDVGSGKTVVATISMYIAYLNGYSSVLMAPTEILAKQHYDTISGFLSPYGITTNLVTAKNKGPRNKKRTKSAAVTIGTHALLSKNLRFPKLGLVVIDEQQRFGVEQRAQIREKGNSPHSLTMTATPIPRTIALTIYADLDLSVIDEMPLGRTTVKTWVVPSEKRRAAYNWIRKQILSSIPRNQVFIVCPFIEASESLTTVKAATIEYESLKSEIFPDLRLGLLHGRMSSGGKDKTLSDFKEGKLDILVSTPVVEVGIDIPNATIMVIEAADRFGLAQLHQLRGRVGRRNIPSYCLLFTEKENASTLKRLKFLESTFSGPKLAELDLELRGPGELFGLRQHGSPGLKIASFSDIKLIEDSKSAAVEILSTDIQLSNYPLLQKKIQSLSGKNVASN
ncbi:MAG: ATP-dependent DNA helicase RecG [Patescibacteria group bacterium]|nr:ATP-dependent DNA helicase RecG [Patescibacteria group bacterium]